MKKFWIYFFTSLSLLALASHLSGYELKSADQQLTWAIATMLTPLGLIQNLLFGQNPELYPYYFQLSTRSGFFDNPQLILTLLVTWIMAVAGLYQFRKRG